MLSPRGLEPAAWHLLMINFIQRMIDGEFDRGMIFAPPGHAKTEYVSIMLPAWYMSLFSSAAIIGASNTKDLAWRNGRKVRNLVVEHEKDLGYSLAPDSQASGRWETNHDGEYYAAGVDGTIIGRRADLVVIDDPIRSREQAENKETRQKLWEWYLASVIGRTKPDAKILVMHTRWHVDDLAGRLIAEQEHGGDKWEILKLPALAIEGQPDPLGRAPGQALWPEWEDEKKLERKRVVVGRREWSSQYQQEPVPDDGVLFNVDDLVLLDHLPCAIESEVRGWDLAATEETGTRDPDWTAGVRIALLVDGRFAVTDVVRDRGTPRDVEHLIVGTAADDGVDVPISIPQDPGQAGKAQVTYLVSQLAGHIVSYSPETGSKVTRAMPVISQCEARNLIVLKRAWTVKFVAELKTFPVGKDDQVDALSRGFTKLVEGLTSVSIIKYYESMMKNTPIDAGHGSNQDPISPRRGPPRPTINAPVDDELVTFYNASLAAMLGEDENVCARCRKPIGPTRITDGANSWHMECN